MLRRQSSAGSAGSGDWDAFAGVLGSARPGAHPADRDAGRTWLIGQTPIASGSGKMLHSACVPCPVVVDAKSAVRVIVHDVRCAHPRQVRACRGGASDVQSSALWLSVDPARLPATALLPAAAAASRGAGSARVDGGDAAQAATPRPSPGPGPMPRASPSHRRSPGPKPRPSPSRSRSPGPHQAADRRRGY